MNKSLILKGFLIAFFSSISTANCFAQTLNVSYNSPNNYMAGIGIEPLNPTVTGGTPIKYSIKPGLPEGLKFDTLKGVISGTPRIGSKETEYAVTATGKTGQSKLFPIKITVSDASGATNTGATNPNASTDCCKITSNHSLDVGEWVMVFMPVLLLLIFIVFLLVYLNKTKDGKEFSLKEALSESSYAQIIKKNAQYNKENIDKLLIIQEINTATAALPVTSLFSTTITKTDNKFRPSISRLIAFLTTSLSLIVGLSLSCFFIYCYLKNGCTPDIGKVSTVLVALGIGVVPYTANKLSGIGSGGANK